ncbi:DsbA family oxidoreductase [Zavarzinia sp. CC-PAN008]|uniref:DsbA family oxidoreductase n=1 Tax=Zavarzinia sp. CC-PAN008 TaxID=3243332 RepID=UPI003F74A2DF
MSETDINAPIRIDIVTDTVCPWCWIGKRRLDEALAARPLLDVVVGYRPYQLNPDMPREGMDRRTYLSSKFRSEEKAKSIYEQITQAGAELGLPFAFDRIGRMPNTLDSHRLIRWAGGAALQPQMIEVLFRRYFADGQDIGDPAVLADAADEAGLVPDLVAELLARGDDTDKIAAEDALAREMGISGVPTFLYDRKYAMVGAIEPRHHIKILDRLLEERAAAAQA